MKKFRPLTPRLWLSIANAAGCNLSIPSTIMCFTPLKGIAQANKAGKSA